MKMKYLVAALTALGVGTANAAITIDVTKQNISAQTIDTVLQNQPTDVDVVFTTTVAVPAGATISLQVNGAKFNPSAAPTAAAAGTLALASATGTLSADNTQAQWTVATGGVATDTLTFNLASVQSTDLRGVTTGTNVDYTITINATGAAIDNTPVKTSPAFALVDTASFSAFNANTDTVDVAQSPSFVFFTTAKGQKTGTAATLTVKNNTSAQATAQGNLVVVLRGDFNGIDKVNGTGITGSSDAGSTAGGTAGEFLIDSSKQSASAVITGGLIAGAANAIAPTFVLDGTTVQQARSFTAELDLLEAGTFKKQDNMVAAQTIEKIVRNGSSFVANSVGNLNKIRVTDRSGNIGGDGPDGLVTITTYTADGTPCTDVPSVNVSSNGSVDILGSDIQSACPGSIRVEGVVNSTAIQVSNIKNNPSTGGISVSPAAVNSGGTGGI